MQITVSNVLTILYLTLLEGVLSVDNALALAALVRGRLSNESDRKRALRYGIFGAYFFRTLMIFGGVWLMQNEWVKWIAGLYLVFLGTKELFFANSGASKEHGNNGWFHFSAHPLIGTIISVELMDIMFSLDSITVALSISKLKWVLISGAVLGILAMRFMAGVFIRLLERFPFLEKLAFLLVLLAGAKIIIEQCGVHIPDIAFMITIFFLIAASFGVNGIAGALQSS